MIGVIDYGMGNLYSVSKALERIEAPYVISEKIEELQKADSYILPGVGAFRDASAILDNMNLKTFIQAAVSEGKLLLGICLGMQLLFEESAEQGISKGLGLLKGKVVKLAEQDQEGNRLKVPHMGWNSLSIHNNSPILTDSEQGYAYFVHSYYVSEMDEKALLASVDYGVNIPAVVGIENVYGVQFHPEKSGPVGMSILKRFKQLSEEQKVKK
ncbi:imidazole glycerol phosphate synthase subunit HisH [Bacillus sp. CLL-7-23]|uniref:Imidazole glycerol phosphate synthase subunit HisH n=1 Tax=Bacillus changyiensis TaxID=3004103 RepID=A0ABT4WZV6_9BACI|nr:imidazole glycerol phosphate synthase subunit HisH [Bacillus changyiensis]MDA7025565.1 imidazole glycerol phosphate synthase subunit HisH [Bacillus changyiensis]